MEHCVYILISSKRDNWSYAGSTSNLEQRLKDHFCGKVIATKGFRPLKIIHKENFSTREKAYERELYFKSGYGREEKNKIIRNSGVVQW